MKHLGVPARSRRGRLMLLAPSTASVPHAFRRVDVDPGRHASVLACLQRLRGQVYVEDGAITPEQLTDDGRHAQRIDSDSWHVVSITPDGRVISCARYRQHDGYVCPEELGVWSSPLARESATRDALRTAVQRDIRQARFEGIGYAEVGGWAVDQAARFSPEALEIALSTFLLAESGGGCIGITTATVRNCSSRILKKIGGRSLESVPAYFDPQYRCEMEILRFDSRRPNVRYLSHLARMAQGFLDLPVVCAKPSTAKVLRLRTDRVAGLVEARHVGAEEGLAAQAS